jgi:hypothetical protein
VPMLGEDIHHCSLQLQCTFFFVFPPLFSAQTITESNLHGALTRALLPLRVSQLAQHIPTKNLCCSFFIDSI